MPYAIELSPRQSARTLEQAVRHQVIVSMTPRIWSDEEVIPCRLDRIETPKTGLTNRAYLVLVVTGDTQGDWSPSGGENQPGFGPNDPRATGPNLPAGRQYADLLGTYCDVVMPLGEHRYMFCSNVVAVSQEPPGSGAVHICLERPETIQVGQRRRFWRFRPAMSSQVELRWVDAGDQSPAHGIGWLCNVSANGMACRVDNHVADRLGIGERIRLVFALSPGDPERFKLEAVLCSKTPAGTPGTIILGLQFITGAEHPASAEAAKQLGRLLLTKYARPIDLSKGADK